MKNLFSLLVILLGVFSMVSCHDKEDPNYEYMPNMYREVSYEAYGKYDVFPNTQEALQPVDGSVPRGWMPYDYEDNRDGYLAAKENLENPLPYTEDIVNEGKALYTIYCAICHGDKGDGKGTLAQREKILGVPAYNDAGRAITEGSVYHVMYYGINTMGSYASQTTEEELWQINHYVMTLKNQLDGNGEIPYENTDGSTEMTDDMVAEESATTEDVEETTEE
ncbi:MAG: cytochrome c [Leeuwenhoekiella sp.]